MFWKYLYKCYRIWLCLLFGIYWTNSTKKAKEREEEQKKGIIRTCYVLKTEKILTIFFIVAVVLFGGATVLSALQQKDLLPPVGFGIFFYYCFNRNSKYDNVET